jgi:tRNA G26 N,N-dimethylase Trm1
LKVIVSLVQRFASRVCVRCQVGSKNGYVVCEELVGSAVCEEFIKKKYFGCTVGAEVVAPADGSKVIVSLVQRFASRVCLRCQVGSKASSGVCEELVGSAVCKELIKKTNFGCTVGVKVVGPADGLQVIVSLVQRFVPNVCVTCQIGSNQTWMHSWCRSCWTSRWFKSHCITCLAVCFKSVCQTSGWVKS